MRALVYVDALVAPARVAMRQRIRRCWRPWTPSPRIPDPTAPFPSAQPDAASSRRRVSRRVPEGRGHPNGVDHARGSTRLTRHPRRRIPPGTPRVSRFVERSWDEPRSTRADKETADAGSATGRCSGRRWEHAAPAFHGGSTGSIPVGGTALTCAFSTDFIHRTVAATSSRCPSGSFRAVVYAGTDPLTRDDIRLRGTCRTRVEAEKALTRLRLEHRDGLPQQRAC